MELKRHIIIAKKIKMTKTMIMKMITGLISRAKAQHQRLTPPATSMRPF